MMGREYTRNEAQMYRYERNGAMGIRRGRKYNAWKENMGERREEDKDIKGIQEGKAIPITGHEGPYRVVRCRGSHILSRQSVHRWRQCCQLYAAAALYSPGRFLVLISLRD
jgi:hypothetical protein